MKKGTALIEKSDLRKFAVIGDVHSCYDELNLLLNQINAEDGNDLRTIIFVGDLTDRGPKPIEVLELVMEMVEKGRAYSVKGNHDEKLSRWLSGSNVKLWHGLDFTVEQLKKMPEKFKDEVKQFLNRTPFQITLDDRKVLVAHAGLNDRLQLQDSDAMRSFALYGETTGKTDEFGLPVRLNWAKSYKGERFVVYGHTPVLEPKWQNNSVNIDTGCAFGGKLTALLYPEIKILQVNSKAQYAQPTRPLI